MTTTVLPGVNTLSAAVATMQNGDVIQMVDGVYTQTTGVVIPTGVQRFSIEGKGSAVTKVVYAANVNGIRSNLSALTYKIHQGKLAGFEMVYECMVPGTGTALAILGSSYNDTKVTNIIVDDVNVVYGTYGTCWLGGLKLINSRVSLIDRFSTRFSPSGRVGTAIELQSCTNVKMTQLFLMSCATGLNLIKAADSHISDVVKHGCEDICVNLSTIHIADIGINLGYKCFMAKIDGCEIEYCTIAGIYEDIALGAENGGYHFIDKNYIGSSTGISNGIWLRRDGSSVTHNNFFGTTVPQNAIRVDSNLNVINGNMCRGLANGSTGILVLGSHNNIRNNPFENSGPLNTDVYIYTPSAVGNLVDGNMIDSKIIDNGTGTIMGVNPVH